MSEHAERKKRQKMAKMLRRALREKRITRDSIMVRTMRGPRTVKYWLSGEVLPPARVLAALEELCHGA